jgi:hypothetical protein
VENRGIQREQKKAKRKKRRPVELTLPMEIRKHLGFRPRLEKRLAKALGFFTDPTGLTVRINLQLVSGSASSQKGGSSPMERQM